MGAFDTTLFDLQEAFAEADKLAGSLDWQRGAILIDAKKLADREGFKEFTESLGLSASAVSKLVTFATYLPADCGLTLSRGYVAARAVKVLGMDPAGAIRLATTLSVSDFMAQVFGKETVPRNEHPCPDCGRMHAIPEHKEAAP